MFPGGKKRIRKYSKVLIQHVKNFDFHGIGILQRKTYACFGSKRTRRIASDPFYVTPIREDRFRIIGTVSIVLFLNTSIGK